MVDKLIYGKNDTNGIVSIEPHDEYAELFIQDEAGNVKIERVKNRYWLLSNVPLSKGWIRLKGEQHYKYGKQYSSREEYSKDRYTFGRRDDVYSIYDPKESLMVKDGYTYFKGLKPKEISVMSFDLETTGLDPHAEDASIILISTTFRCKDAVVKRLFSYDEYRSEGQMIHAFAEYVRKCDPSCIVGHNVYSFDIPYLIGRSENCEVELSLGRDGSAPDVASYESKFRLDGTRDLHYNKVRIYGREIVDTMFLAYKYDIGKKYESYGLKKIISQEGLEKKDRVFYDANKIRFNYKDPVEFEKIKAYCVDDSDDALSLFDLMVPAFFYMTQMIPKSFQTMIESASGSQLNSLMVRSYLQDGHSVSKASMTNKFDGAISFGIPGIYRNALKIDVTSLYPSLILQYEIFDKKKDPNGHLYQVTKYLRDERIKNKKLAKETGDVYYTNLEQAQKVLINSLYGFMAAPGLNYNSPDNAAMVTEKGRDILKFSIEWATGKKAEEVIPVKEDESHEEQL